MAPTAVKAGGIESGQRKSISDEFRKNLRRLAEQSNPKGAHKGRSGLYPGPEAVEAFADKLTDYKTSKGTIQLPYSKPLPLELIAEIAAWCETNGQKNV